MKDTMKDWIVKINRDTSWTVQHRVTKEHRKMWSKQDVEDFLDWQENLVAQVQGGNDERSSH
jgi:hypothetical protein